MEMGKAFIYETPLPVDGVCSMIDLDCLADVVSDERVVWLEVDQCRWGSYSVKPTLLLLFLVEPPCEAVREAEHQGRRLLPHEVQPSG